MRRMPAVLTTAVAALGLIALTAAPASAASIPADEAIYVIGVDGNLYVSTDKGALTLVGAMSVGGNVYGADIDQTTGIGYFFDDSESPCDLYSLDVATGASTLVGPLGFDNCDGLDIDDAGTLRVLTGDSVLYSVDKATGATISSVTVSGIGEQEIAFIATDPVSGILYTGDYQTDVYTLDPTTGVATPAGEVDYIESGDFDSAGTFWAAGDGAECQGLASFSATDITGSYALEGDFTFEGECVNAYAIFVDRGELPAPAPAPAPEPQLAATGAESAVVPLSLAAFAVLAGLALMAIRRRTV